MVDVIEPLYLANFIAFEHGNLSAIREPFMPFQAALERYNSMRYNRVGKGELQLPEISLGLWQKVGGEAPSENKRMALP